MNIRGKTPATIERENALLDFVNQQAQEEILDPNLPDSYKNEVVNAAIGTIQKSLKEKQYIMLNMAKVVGLGNSM